MQVVEGVEATLRSMRDMSQNQVPTDFSYSLEFTVKSMKQDEVMLKTGPVKFTQIILHTIANYGLPR